METSLLSSPYTWAITALSGLYLLYRHLTSTFTFFSDQGIPGPKPWPVIGNLWGIWKANLPEYDMALMRKYGKVVGYFDGSRPNLLITDADLIRSIFVKDFDHFVNRRDFEFTSKVVRKMMSLIRDQPWKDIRSAVTPAFTTGKIKRMSVMIEECSQRLATKFADIANNEGKINAKTQFSAFTMDVIARTAFGMKIADLGKADDPFMKHAKTVFSPPVNKTPVVLAPFVLPSFVTRLIGEKVFLTESFQFFINVLEGLINERSKSSEKYHDFVEAATETILEYKKEVNGKSVPMWTREEVDEIVIAQSTLFLVAGFDTTATTLTNSTYLLAKHPEIQERLYEEITAKLEKYDGKVSHEMILDFPYLDQVVHEVLRMYSPVTRVERECNKDITYGKIQIKKGMIVSVPSYPLHYDEGYYPKPNTFNPDRWAPENKSKLNPYTWMPFGMGPRNCVGMRFAIEEIKIALATLVSQVRFFPVPETPDKMIFEEGFLQIVQPAHATLGIEMRSN